MNTQSRFNENRRSPRVSLDVVLFFRVDKPPEVRLRIGDTVKTGHSVDISEVGISFLVDSEIPKATELEATFNLVISESRKSKISVGGEVVYCFPRDPGKMYRVGVLFTTIEEKDKKLIADYVKFAFLNPRPER